MSANNVNSELERGPVGMGIRKISQTVDHSEFTKSTNDGTLTMTPKLPAGAFVVGTKVDITEVFDGTTNTMQVGASSGEDEYSDDTTIAVGTVAVVGAPSVEYVAAEQSVYLKIAAGEDWDNITTGNMKIEIFYLSTVLELPVKEEA